MGVDIPQCTRQDKREGIHNALLRGERLAGAVGMLTFLY